MKRVGIIDIGSNSVKLFVGEKSGDGSLRTVIDESDVVRLSEGLRDTGKISGDALERNALAVERFAAKALELGAGEIVCVGTMALRTAANSADFVRRVRELSGLDVEIIPGEEEARLSYLAVVSGDSVPGGDGVIFDTGGGSTEFIFGRGTEPGKRFSVNVGSVRITEEFFPEDPVTEGSVGSAIREIDREFANAGVSGSPAYVVGIGGNVTCMAAVRQKLPVYDRDALQGSILTREDIAAQISGYSARTVAERRLMPGMVPQRADIILAGACILKVITDRLNADRITVSCRGLRHGLALEILNGTSGYCPKSS